MIQFLHEKVRILGIDKKEYIGIVVDFENDFETDSGHDEITIQQDGVDYELTFESTEILEIGKIA